MVFVGCGLYLVGRSIWLQKRSTALRLTRLMSLSIGLVILATAVLLRSSVALDALTGQIADTSGFSSIIVLVGSLVGGIALGDYVFARLVPRFASFVGRDHKREATTHSLFILVAGVALIALSWFATQLVDPEVEVEVGGTGDLSVELIAEFELPDEPRDLVFTGPASGYISFPHEINFFQVAGSGERRELTLEEAVGSDGIDNPRGMALSDGYLFVSEQGQPEEEAPSGMYSTNGQVVRFDATPDGNLSNRTVIVDNVPVVGVLHGINGLAVGGDSMIYLSVGNTKDVIEPEPPNVDWLGSILRFDPDGNEVEGFAYGLRNVYDLEFDEQDRLWAVDNDGPTHRGYRAEEILQIKEGNNYGYPNEGTFGDYQMRTDRPIWAYTGHDLEGTAGIELAQNLGLDTGILIGARSLTYFRYAADEDGFYASTDYDFQGAQEVFARQGYFTIVEADASDLLYVGVTGLSLESNLYLLDLSN